jgi:hypothetical protein
VQIQALVHPASKVVREGALVIGVANVGAAALAPLLRFRRADPVQRQQLTWFAFVIVLIVVAFLVGIAVQGALPIVATVLVTVGFGGVLVGFPAAVGLAILGVAALFQPARRRIQQGRGSRRTGLWGGFHSAVLSASTVRSRADSTGPTPRSTIPAVQTVPLMEDT